MKKLFEYFEAASKLIAQKVIVYPGRFHPPGPHHFAAYRTLREVASKLGAKVVVAMSGVEGDAKHPYSYNKRKKIWQKAFPDVELVKIKESDMYKPDAVVKNGKYSNYVYIVSLGDKDQQGDKPRISIGGVNKKGEPKFFKQQFTAGELIKAKSGLQTADKAGYVLVTNDAVMVGDSKVSATVIREEIKNKNIKKLNQIYAKYPSVVSELLHEDVEFSYVESITHHKHVEELLYDHDLKDIIAIFKDTVNSLNPFSSSKTQTKTQFKVDGCFHEDTKLYTSSGMIPFKELDKLDNRPMVMTRDLINGVDEYSSILNSVRANTLGDKKWVEIILDNNEKILLTEDHRVYTKNKGWVEAKNLTPEDDIYELAD